MKTKTITGKKKRICQIAAAGMTLLLAGCGQVAEEETAEESRTQEEAVGETESSGDTFAGESAADGHVDFDALQQINPDIFAWLYVPGAGIDVPVLQSHISDEYYISHGPDGAESETGAVYTEMPNLMNMCDFNTIVHGKDEAEGDWFYGLHRYEDAEFFGENEEFYLYLPDNVLRYEIVGAYYEEGSDILRRHDYTTYEGCQAFLDEMFARKSMGKNIRKGWEDLTPYHFLVTLDGRVRDDNTQYVVVGALVEDAAGNIDRMILE